MRHWNRLYGPKGLFQHQSAIPFGTARDAIPELLRATHRAEQASFLTVLKRFGDMPSPGLLSFPRPGYTLTLDFANRGASTLELLEELDRITVAAGGAVNPYKDARMSSGDIRSFVSKLAKPRRPARSGIQLRFLAPHGRRAWQLVVRNLQRLRSSGQQLFQFETARQPLKFERSRHQILSTSLVGRARTGKVMKYIGFILFTVMTNAAAQLMLKHGMTQLGSISFANANPILKILEIVFSPWVFAGLLTFVISMASHLFVLSKVELSFAYPFLSLAYVAVAVFAYFLFHEDLNAYRIAGIGFICVGTVLIAQSGAGHAEVAHTPTPKTIQTSELVQ